MEIIEFDGKVPFDLIKEFGYQYRTVRVEHLQELHQQREELDHDGKISGQANFRKYISRHRFSPPETLPDAKFIIALAIFTPLVYVNFHWKGQKHEVMLPPQYYLPGYDDADCDELVFKEIIPVPGFKIEQAQNLPLKALSVKSGLGRYGRNNICYVGDMGTCITLMAYFTDYEFSEDHWGEMKMLDQCEKCRVCIELCPTKAIREDNFVIDVARCVTLYNEIKGDFPDWIEPGVHNALVGCMRCQFKCPANRMALQRLGRLPDITEEETAQIMSGHLEESARKIVYEKLRKFGFASSQEEMPSFVRNLGVLLNQQA